MKKIVLSFFVSVMLFPLAMPSVSHAQSQEDIRLETIGALSVQGIYLTYSSIGSLADAYENEVYEKKQTLKILSEYLALAKVAKSQLEKMVDETNLSEGDEKIIQQCIEIYILLIAEGEALEKYVETGTSSYTDTFHNKRKAAWTKIKALLNLK